METKEIELKVISDAEMKKTNENSPSKKNDETDYFEKKIEIKEDTKTTPVIDTEPDGTMNSTSFAINLMKGIAGTGSLAVPLAIKSVGIVCGVILFLLVSLVYIYSSYQLITMKNTLGPARMKTNAIRTNNDYARLCYISLGKPGYYLFNFALLVTLYGACIGTMVVMTDFLQSLPILNEYPFIKKLISQIILAIVAIILCMLKDPSLLVGISSIGLLALVFSYILLFYYGITNSHFSFESSYLWPKSVMDFLNNFGIFIYSLGFTLFLLSQVKSVKKLYRANIVKTISVSVILMALIYACIGVIFYTLLETSEYGVKGNILRSLPSNHWVNILISALMVFTCIGGYPLYMSPIHEVVEKDYGEIKTNEYFILNRDCWIFRGSEIALISIIAFLVPSFSDILSFNILFKHSNKHNISFTVALGNFSSILVATILPSIMYIRLMGKSISIFSYIMNIIIIIVFSIIMVVCTSVSFSALLKTFS